MIAWLKDHALEIVALVISVVGARGVVDFWSRLCEMFEGYKTEAVFVCTLSAAVGAVVSLLASRVNIRKMEDRKNAEREHLLAEKGAEIEKVRREKDAEIAKLITELQTRPAREELDNAVKAGTAPLAAEVERLVAENGRMRAELERRDREDGAQYMRDVMDDYEESGLKNL